MRHAGHDIQAPSFCPPDMHMLTCACMRPCREKWGLTTPARDRRSASSEDARRAAAREIRKRDMGVFAGVVDAIEDAIDGLSHATAPQDVNEKVCVPGWSGHMGSLGTDLRRNSFSTLALRSSSRWPVGGLAHTRDGRLR